MTRDRLLEYHAKDGVMVLIKGTKPDSADFLKKPGPHPARADA